MAYISPHTNGEVAETEAEEIVSPSYVVVRNRGRSELDTNKTCGNTTGIERQKQKEKVLAKKKDSVTVESIEVQQKRNGRKGGKKSRSGCFTCKRQKLKCKENRPTCDYCAHRDIKCEWPMLSKPMVLDTPLSTTTRVIKPTVLPNNRTVPSVTKQRHNEAHLPVLKRLPRSLQAHDRPPVFGMQDMRLFNHFIQNAYPNHPHGNDSVWTHEIPSLASDYDYLIHSMLALAASEISLIDRRKSPERALALQHTSIYHRSRAVSSLSRATQRGILSSAEGNAMLATILSLIFQSTFLADGLVEYMSFIRGAIVVSSQMDKQGLAFLFRNANSEGGSPGEDEGQIVDAPLLDCEVTRGSVKSLELVAELCQTKLEETVWKILMDAARPLQVSSAGAYIELRKVYGLFAHGMTQAEFNDFTSPLSPSAQTYKILQAHFVALQLIMEPATKSAVVERAECPVKELGRAATVGWLSALHADVEKRNERYIVWTRFVEREILSGRLLDGSKAEGVCVFEEDGCDVGSENESPEEEISGTASVNEMGESGQCPWVNGDSKMRIQCGLVYKRQGVV